MLKQNPLTTTSSPIQRRPPFPPFPWLSLSQTLFEPLASWFRPLRVSVVLVISKVQRREASISYDISEENVCAANGVVANS